MKLAIGTCMATGLTIGRVKNVKFWLLQSSHFTVCRNYGLLLTECECKATCEDSILFQIMVYHHQAVHKDSTMHIALEMGMQ